MIADPLSEPIGLRVEEVAHLLDVSPNTVTFWIRQKRLPAYRVGRQYRIRRADLACVVIAEEAVTR